MKQVSNRELIPLATAFRAELKKQKEALQDARWDWYPYDTLSNFTHMAELLGGAGLEFCELAGAGPVADIGCADGDLALFLASLGCEVDAVDNLQDAVFLYNAKQHKDAQQTVDINRIVQQQQ